MVVMLVCVLFTCLPRQLFTSKAGEHQRGAC